jgi:hypothetical protein
MKYAMERVTRFSAIAALALSGLTGVALAQDIDQSKVYVSDPSACTALAEKGASALEDVDFLALTFPDGIQSYEFHCDFFDVKARKGSPFLFVDAVCEAPGEVYPDTLSISPWDETQIQVVSTYDTTMVMSGGQEPPGPTTNPGVTMYTRCDNLSEIPVD